MYVLPTFKTGIDANPYKVEPAVIILKYEEYINILLSLMFDNAWQRKIKADEEKESENWATIFRAKYKR